MSAKFKIASVVLVFLLFGFFYFIGDRNTRFYLNNTLLNEYNVHVQIYVNGELLLDENIEQNLITYRFSYSFKQKLNKKNGILLEVILPELNESRQFKFDREKGDFVFITLSYIIEPYKTDIIDAQVLPSKSVKEEYLRFNLSPIHQMLGCATYIFPKGTFKGFWQSGFF